MHNTKLTPAQPDLPVSSPAAHLAVTTRAPSGIVLAPAPAHHDTSIARANRATPVDPQVEDQQYEPQAIMFAGWCLQSAPQWQRDVDYSTWSPEYQRLCSKLNTRPLAGWEAYSFEMINGYNPRDLQGADAYLFRIYMRVWQERFGSPRLTAQRRLAMTVEVSTPPHQVGDVSNQEAVASAQRSMCRLFESWLPLLAIMNPLHASASSPTDEPASPSATPELHEVMPRPYVYDREGADFHCALWYAAWCLRAHVQQRLRLNPPAWVTARTFESHIATLQRSYDSGGIFKWIYGYDPEDLSGIDAFLFRVHMQAWRERQVAPVLGNQQRIDHVPHQVADAELNAALARLNPLSIYFRVIVGLRPIMEGAETSAHWIRPWNAEWDLLFSRIFLLTYIGTQHQQTVRESTPPQQDGSGDGAQMSDAHIVVEL